MKTETNKLKFYSKNKEIFDDLPIEDYQALKEDIKKNGIKTDLHITKDNIVLCGNQRLKIAIELKLKEVPVKVLDISEEEIEDYVIKDNFLRRHLSPEQKAVLYSKLAEKYKGRKGERTDLEHSDKMSLCGKTSELIAKELYGETNEKIIKAKSRTIERGLEYVKIIKEKPELKNKFESISGVVREYKKQKFLEERYEKIDESIKDYKLIKGDAIEELKNIRNAFVDCVISDSPYGINYIEKTESAKVEGQHILKSVNKNFNDNKKYALELLDKTCFELKRICKDNAHLYFFFGIENYKEVFDILNKYFLVDKVPLIWIKDNFSLGRQVNKQYMLMYEPIFFCKNKNDTRLLNNKATLNTLNFNRVYSKLHPTQKPVKLIESLILNSTIEGEVVLDCFAGSGSTIISALKNNRKAIGIEIDSDYFKLMEQRIYKEIGIGKLNNKISWFNFKTSNLKKLIEGFFKDYYVLIHNYKDFTAGQKARCLHNLDNFYEGIQKLNNLLKIIIENLDDGR